MNNMVLQNFHNILIWGKKKNHWKTIIIIIIRRNNLKENKIFTYSIYVSNEPYSLGPHTVLESGTMIIK